jgi:hypothetical protein
MSTHDVFDRDRFEAAYKRLRKTPLELTDADLEQLATLDETFETEGREARTQAQLALVHKHMPALQTKDASTVDRSRRPLKVKHLEVFADQFGTMLIAIIKKNVLPLKEKIAQLEARCLELEADRAARTVTPDGDLTR